jgi:hypothetical protein
MRAHPIDKRPASWPLYGMGAMLVGAIGLIETSVPSSAARLFLDLATVVAVFMLLLGWLRVNRARIAPRAARPRGTSDGALKGGDLLMADKPNQPKPAQPSGGQPKPSQPQPSTPKK